MLQFESEESPEAEFSLSLGISVNFLLRPLTDFIRPTYIMPANLLYSKSIISNVNPTQNIPSQQHPDRFLTRCLDALAKLTYKINHHTGEQILSLRGAHRHFLGQCSRNQDLRGVRNTEQSRERSGLRCSYNRTSAHPTGSCRAVPTQSRQGGWTLIPPVQTSHWMWAAYGDGHIPH